MQLTNAGEYAVRAMLSMALQPKGTVSTILDVAREGDIPLPFLRKIVPLLTRSGYLHSSRGIGGGISLAKEADAITLLDVVEAIEGPMMLNNCLLEPTMCHRQPYCAVHLVWREAQEKLKETLGRYSIAELAASSGKHKPRIRRTNQWSSNK
jgi:Rrf2 family protein